MFLEIILNIFTFGSFLNMRCSRLESIIEYHRIVGELLYFFTVFSFLKKHVGYSPFSSMCLPSKENSADVLNLFHLIFQWFSVCFIPLLTHLGY